MTRLHNATMSTEDFHFDKKLMLLSAEASELRIPVGCNVVSIKLKSKATGRVAFFKYDQEAAIAAEFWDGEWAEYRSDDEFAKHLKLVIYNT